MTTEASAWYVYIPLLYITYWRGLTALSILCDLGNAKVCVSRMGERNRHLRLFCVYARTKGLTLIAELGCDRQEKGEI